MTAPPAAFFQFDMDNNMEGPIMEQVPNYYFCGDPIPYQCENCKYFEGKNIYLYFWHTHSRKMTVEEFDYASYVKNIMPLDAKWLKHPRHHLLFEREPLVQEVYKAAMLTNHRAKSLTS